MKKVRKIIFISLLFLFLTISVLLNVYLLKVNKRAKNTIAYSLSDDYLLNQIIITKNDKEKIVEYENDYYKTNTSSGDTTSNKTTELIKIPKINQLPDYPNGCEAASATMLLTYYGINITLKEFIEKYLPTKDVYVEDGSLFGPDPSVFYAGDPASIDNGWGCYEPAIENTINRIFYDKNIDNFYVKNLSQKPIEELFNNSPVVIWVKRDYSEETNFTQWYSYDKTQTYTYTNKTHAVVLIGYDKDFYYIADPLKDEEVTKVEKNMLEASYDSLGRQAVTIYSVN